MSYNIFMMTKFQLYALLLLLVGSNLTVHSQSRRDLFQRTYENQEFDSWFSNSLDWVPFPKYRDRDAWGKLSKDILDVNVSKAESYLDFGWPTIPATAYLEFKRTGDRSAMQVIAKERLNAFHALVWAELMEGKGRFLDQIINSIYVYSEQTTWNLSAHLFMQRAGEGLPDTDGVAIDMQTAELAGDLAWAYYFFKDEFDKTHPLINKRLNEEIHAKLLDPFYETEKYWWMGFKGDEVNNWNPWCNYNILLAILMFEKDNEKKMFGIRKAMRSLDKWLNMQPNDGACEEGTTYWNAAGGKLFDILDLLYRVTDGKVNIFDEPLVQDMGKYIYRAYISESYFQNFADAHPTSGGRATAIYKFGKRINDETMTSFGAYLASVKKAKTHALYNRKIEFPLYEILFAAEIETADKTQPLIADFWLKDTQIMGAREFPGSSNGFYIGAKGGHNEEFHNHNDIGSFMVYVNGKPCLIDIGMGTYTKQYFGDERYDHMNTRSKYHNIPVINGFEQMDGRSFKAKDLAFNSSNAKVSFSLDIAEAYPKEALVNSWVRSYVLDRGKGLFISDEFDLKKNHGNTEIRFVTPANVELLDSGELKLQTNDYKILLTYNSKVLKPFIEDLQLEDNTINNNWKNGLKVIKFKYIENANSNSSSIKLIQLME